MVQESREDQRLPPSAPPSSSQGPPRPDALVPRQRSEDEAGYGKMPSRESFASQTSTAFPSGQSQERPGPMEQITPSSSQKCSVAPSKSQPKAKAVASKPGSAGSVTRKSASPSQFASPDSVPRRPKSSRTKSESPKPGQKKDPEISPRTMKKTAENIKQEKLTPPSKPLTNTMHSDKLKGLLLGMNTEMELPMNVPGSQVFL